MKTNWYMQRGSKEWKNYMRLNRPQELAEFKRFPVVKHELTPDEILRGGPEKYPEEWAKMSMRPGQTQLTEGFPDEKIKNPPIAIYYRDGSFLENVVQGKEIPTWLVLLHLFPKKLNSELHAGVAESLEDFYGGRALPQLILYRTAKGERTLHISGDGGVNSGCINYWTEKVGDPKFHGMMDKMRKILRRKLWDV